MITKRTEDRLRIYWLIMVGIFSILAVRLAMLQLVQASDYRMLSEKNRVRIIPVRAPRGEIIDRQGIVLAKNKQVFSVSISQMPGQQDQTAVINTLAGILGPYYPEITPEYIQSLMEQSRSRRYEPVVVKRNIDMNIVTQLEELREELPGVSIDVEPIRVYPGLEEGGGALAGHILGFVREISAKELEERNQQASEEGGFYQLGDLIGKDGLEKQYEDQLRGRDGARQVEVDAYNRPVRELKTVPAVAGNSLVLTLDARLQQVLEKSMDETLASLQRSGKPKARAGAAVVIDVQTGAILAMASRPALNPNDFVGSMSQAQVDFYYRSQPAAAINRAIAGVYPPGSTFKPVTALAALESKSINPEAVLVNCPGYYWLPPYIKCWGVHGAVNLIKAMAVSCNTYFQEAARLAGIDWIVNIARQFGLGNKTGIDLPGEAKGLLPSPEWKREVNARLIDSRYQRKLQELEQHYSTLIGQAADEKTRQELMKKKEQERRSIEAQYKIEYEFNTAWQGFDTFNTSIGQGHNSYTPLQLAVYTAALANGGKVYKPYLVDRIVAPDGSVVQRFEPVLVNQLAVSPENLETVRRAMRAVAEPGGTAWSLFYDFPPNVTVAAKTGTAQTGRRGDDPSRDFHGLFIAFAPYEQPRIAVACVIEYGGHGSSSAGYVARAVFQQYFGLTSAPSAGVSKPAGEAAEERTENEGVFPDLEPQPAIPEEEIPLPSELPRESSGEGTGGQG